MHPPPYKKKKKKEVGELETVTGRQREEVQAFGKLQPSEERALGVFTEASGSVFSCCLQQLGHWGL